MPMNVSCGSSSSSKRILSEERGIDRLSNLPEFVLHHVLSFLETRDVVRTSVLSTRWQCLWTCVSNIDLEYRLPYNEDKYEAANILMSFLEFVDKLLILHDASNIQRLRLRFYMPVDHFRLNVWICAAIKHNVQHLDLDLVLKENVQHLDMSTTAETGYSELPLCLFTCNSLTVLKLDVECILKVPVAARLSNLRKLHLSSVIFADDISAQRLFNNCPVLTKLSLVKCDWDNIDNITISIPTLKKVVIVGDEDNEWSDSHVQIVAANLKRLTFSSHLDVDFEWSDLSSLSLAAFHLPYFVDWEEESQDRAIRLFHQIHNTVFLCISGITLKCLMNVEAILDHLPTFHRLFHLEVGAGFFPSCSNFLLDFLEKMPELIYLDLAEGFSQEPTTAEASDVMQHRVPSCFNSNLTFVTLACFKAEPHEMALLEYVMRFATRLQSLVISCSVDLQGKKFVEADNQLLNIPLGSESCKVGFSFPWLDE